MRAQRRENKRYSPSVGFMLPQRHFKKWGRGESARWSEQGLKIARDNTETARLLMCTRTQSSAKKKKKNAHNNGQKQTSINKEACINTCTTHTLLTQTECNLESKSAACWTVSAGEDWLQLIMSLQEVVSLYLSPLLRPADQSTGLDLVKIAVKQRKDWMQRRCQIK